MVMGRTESKLVSVRDEITNRGERAILFAGDVKQLADIERCVAMTVTEFGTVDILVNNAQEVALGSLLEVADADVTAGWESGPMATLRFMRACHPHLVGGGAIVNMGSRAGVRPDPIRRGAYAAVKEAIRRAAPVFLEPIMKVEITTPKDFFGDVLGDLNKRRAHIMETDQRGHMEIIRAQVPLAELFGYATDLRSMTQGRATYAMEFLHYEEVPRHVAATLSGRAQIRA